VWMSGPAMGSVNLLTNGDFESNGSGNISNANLPGWNASPENHTHIDVDSDPNRDQYAALNHNGKNFAIAQKFHAVAGTQYELTYDFGVGRRSTSDENLLFVAVGPRSGPIFGTINSAVGPNRGQLWQTFTYDFTADTTEKFQVLFESFGSTDNVADTALIDNVSIRAVPEASTLVLFGALIAGGLMMLRRRTLNTA